MKIIKLILLFGLIINGFTLMPVQAGSMFVTSNNQTLSEGGNSLTFKLKFSAKPTTGNNTSLQWQTNNQCQLSHENRGYVSGGQVVTTSDYVVFSAKAVDDADEESTHSCSISYKTTSGDVNLNNLKTTQNFTILDNGDAPAIVPALYTTVIGPSSISEGSGAIYSFGIGPSTVPTDKLVITASTNDGQCEIVSGGQTLNYIEQVVPAGVQGAAIFTVRTINDAIVEGNHSCSVNHSLRTDDLTYTGMTIGNTQVPINDDEAPFESESVDSEELLARPEYGLLDANDANNDGIDDSKQLNLGVFINEVSGRRQAIWISSPNANCNAVSTPLAESEDSNSKQNEAFHFPHGLINFRVICDRPGAEATVTYYLDEFYNMEGIELQEYADATGYQKIEGIKTSTTEVQNGTISLIEYRIKDGGELDEDQTENGIIVDPVGIAVSANEPQVAAFQEINNANDSDRRVEYLVFAIPFAIIMFMGGSYVIKRTRRKSRSS